jgi:CysZ protein
MINDIARVLNQLPEPRLLRPVLWGLVLSAIVLAALVGGVFWVLNTFVPEGQSWLGRQLDAVGFYEIAGTVLVAWLALLLFPAVALTVQSVFLDSVTDAVEAKYYSHLPPAREVPIAVGIGSSIQLTLVVIAVNLLLLPVYLLLLLLPPTGLLLYYAVNGYLVGREYFEVVGLRRQTLKELKTLRRRNRTAVWLDGILLVLVFTVPLLNLAGPTLGTAYMVHRYHRLKKP